MHSINEMACVETIKKVMKIFDGKWALLIMADLSTGTKRFNELSRDLNISTKALSDALKKLESNGIIIRTVRPTVPVIVEYSLTEKGRDFDRIFFVMQDWGMKWIQ